MKEHKHSRDPLRNHGYTNMCSCGAFYDKGEWHESRERSEVSAVEEYQERIVHTGDMIEFNSDLEPIDVVHLADAAFAELEAANKRANRDYYVAEEARYNAVTARQQAEAVADEMTRNWRGAEADLREAQTIIERLRMWVLELQEKGQDVVGTQNVLDHITRSDERETP